MLKNSITNETEIKLKGVVNSVEWTRIGAEGGDMNSSGFAIKAYIVALLTLLFGVVFSLNLHDWSWFSRSGSLVVVNGIILTSHQIIEHVGRLNRRRSRWESQFNHDWADDDKQNLIYRDEHLWATEKYGLYMLIIGTLVWGFGDLLGEVG